MKYLKFVALFLIWPLGAAYADGSDNLKAEIERHAVNGNVNISMAAIHLRTGEIIEVGGNQVLPLASTYKIPMAALALTMVEEGTLALDQMISVKDSDRVVSSQITQSFPHSGVSLSLLNLLEPMLIHSDNTATDVVLRTIGGGEHLTAWLRTKGVENLRVDRPTADLIRDFYRIPRTSDPDLSLVTQYEVMLAEGFSLDDHDPQDLYDDFLDDPRDHGSALAMAGLLRQIWSGELLNDKHTAVLKAIMKRCLTGANRLSGNLPAHALPISHKTGSIGGTIDDAGVMDMPNGDQVVIVVYTSGPAAESGEMKEKAIAEIARSVYDYFLYK